MSLPIELTQFLASVHPYDSLTETDLSEVAKACSVQEIASGTAVFSVGDDPTELYIIVKGEVEITDQTGVQLSLLGPRNSFGERALLRGETTTRTARAITETTLVVLPKDQFFALIKAHSAVSRFFDRRRPPLSKMADPTTTSVQKMDDTKSGVGCAVDKHSRRCRFDERPAYFNGLYR